MNKLWYPRGTVHNIASKNKESTRDQARLAAGASPQEQEAACAAADHWLEFCCNIRRHAAICSASHLSDHEEYPFCSAGSMSAAEVGTSVQVEAWQLLTWGRVFRWKRVSC